MKLYAHLIIRNINQQATVYVCMLPFLQLSNISCFIFPPHPTTSLSSSYLSTHTVPIYLTYSPCLII